MASESRKSTKCNKLHKNTHDTKKEGQILAKFLNTNSLFWCKEISVNLLNSMILLTTRGRERLDKLIILQVHKKLPEFYGPPEYITVFRTARRLSLS